MLKRFVPSFLLLVIFLAPSANTTLRAQLSQVFEADSTQEWWVYLKGGHLYYGYIRALGTDSIRVIEGERGEKHLAIIDVMRVTPKGTNFVPLSAPHHAAYGRYLQPFAVNALPHDNEVYIKLRHFITPELEVNFLNRHSLAGFISIESADPFNTRPFGFRYRYALPLNERLHWAGCAVYRRSQFRHEYVLSSIITFDAGFVDLSFAPLFYQFVQPANAFFRAKAGSGAATAAMLQVPLGNYIAFNADWLFIPLNKSESTAFSSDFSGHNLMLGLKVHLRKFHLQISYLERSSIQSFQYWRYSLEDRWKIAMSVRIGKKKTAIPE